MSATRFLLLQSKKLHSTTFFTRIKKISFHFTLFQPCICTIIHTTNFTVRNYFWENSLQLVVWEFQCFKFPIDAHFLDSLIFTTPQVLFLLSKKNEKNFLKSSMKCADYSQFRINTTLRVQTNDATRFNRFRTIYDKAAAMSGGESFTLISHQMNFENSSKA